MAISQQSPKSANKEALELKILPTKLAPDTTSFVASFAVPSTPSATSLAAPSVAVPSATPSATSLATPSVAVPSATPSATSLATPSVAIPSAPSFATSDSTTITFVTWNVNSLRARMQHVSRFLIEHAPDVLCLQETKLTDDLFPQADFEELGYQAVWWGEKSYNGVAIVSKYPIINPTKGINADDKQSRLISCTIEGIRVINSYFPQGRSVDSEQFLSKLGFYQELLALLEKNYQPNQPMVLAGDFNVAPTEKDVYNAKAMENQVSFHPAERDALTKLLNWGWSDAFRLLNQQAGHHTWWDFRTAGWQKKQGLRLDHIWLTAPLSAQLLNCWIEPDERARPKPSDHAPVLAEIKWSTDRSPSLNF